MPCSGDAEKSLAAGMQGHIPKPIDEALLLSQLKKWAIPGPYDNSQEAPEPQPEPTIVQKPKSSTN